MPKIVPHRVSFSEIPSHPLLVGFLEEEGFVPDRNGDYRFHIECEDFLVFPNCLREHRVMKILTDKHMFEFDAEQNRVTLPTSLFIAHCLKRSAYADSPIDSYLAGLI